MAFSSLLNYLQANILLTVAGLLVIIIILAVMILRVKQRSDDEQDSLRRRQESLWQELDELRVDQGPPGGVKTGNPVSGSVPGSLEKEQFAVERKVYEELWPLVWSLHDRVGAFLRTVDADDAANDSRLAARKAALETRTAMNRLRPFYSDSLDELLVQFVDTEIQVHLSACQYLDNRVAQDGALKKTDQGWEAYRSKSRQLYDDEARTILNQLMTVMRRRMVRPETN